MMAVDVLVTSAKEAAPIENLVFVDQGVDQFQALLDQVQSSPATRIVLLDSDLDPLVQMTDVLSSYRDLASVQIISHGNEYGLRIGDSAITVEIIEEYRQQLATWQTSLSANADILLFGCNIAAGENPVFVKRFAELTGADVAASVNLTGAKTLGGDWNLEYATGTIEAGQFITSENASYPGVLFKPYTHVAVARAARADLLDGNITIQSADNSFVTVPVNPAVVTAITNHPGFYYAGTIGPDGFPDFIMGQGVAHPINNGLWLKHILAQAWAAQTDSNNNNGVNRQPGENGNYTAVEKQQILAYAYGFLTHSAGDIWAHTLVNDIAEGVFPDVIGDPSEENLHIVLSHILAEGYIGDATPGFDGNGDESNNVKTFNGAGVLVDVVIDQTPGVELPTNAAFRGTSGGVRRFIYESTILPQPASTGLSQGRGVAIDTIVEMRDGLQVKLNNLIAEGVTVQDINAVHDRFNNTNRSFKLAEENLNNAGRHLSDAFDTLTALESAKAALENTKANINAVLEDEKCSFDGSFFDKVANAFRCGGALIGAGLTGGLNIVGGFATDVVNSASQAVQAAAQLVLAAKNAVEGAATGLANLVVQLATDEKALRAAYLDNWIKDIDDGLAQWPELGLRISRGLFDPETKRQIQNETCEDEVNNARITCEAGVGMVDVILAVVDTPPGFNTTAQVGGVLDGTSFLDDHLLKMFLPDLVGDIRSSIRKIGGVLDDIDLFDGILDFVTKPLEAVGEKIQDEVQGFIVDQISDAIGVDLDLLGSLIHSPSSKLGLERIGCPELVNGQPIAATACAGKLGGLPGIDMFDAEDRERLDRAMGLITNPSNNGAQLHVPFQPFRDGSLAGNARDSLPTEPFFSFHENKVGGFLDSVEFTPRPVAGGTTPAIFPAFENAVTITKLAFLDGAGMDQFINAQLTNQLGSNQHFSLYSQFGVLGNVMTIALPELPMPAGATSSNFVPKTNPHDITVPPGVPPENVQAAADPTNPNAWIRSIDGDHPWQSGREPVFPINGERSYASAGHGNFPLFEVGVLRENVFREIFLDWENDLRDDNRLNGSSVFPDFKDTPRDSQSLVVTTKDDIVDWYDHKNSLREAILFANSGDADHDGNVHDTITFAANLNFDPATRAQPLSFAQDTLNPASGELLVTQSLTIDASMLNRQFTIDANFRSRAINVTGGNLTVKKLHIIGGSTSSANAPGAGIRVAAGSLTAIGSEFTENRTHGNSSPGAGLFASGPIVLTNSAVIDSLTRGSNSQGGGIYSPSSITIKNSTLSGNSTVGYFSPGGAVASPSQITILNSTVSGNSTSRSNSPGGAISAINASLVADNLVLGNTAIAGNSTNGAAGGGIHASKAKITNGIIVGNAAIGQATGNFEVSPTTTLRFFGGNLVGQFVSGTPTFNTATQPNTTNATNVAQIFEQTVTTLFDSDHDGTPDLSASGVLTGRLKNNGGSTETLQLFNVVTNQVIDKNPPVSLFRFEGTATASIGTNNGTFQGGLTATAPGATDVSPTSVLFTGNTAQSIQLSQNLTIGNSSNTIEAWIKVPTVGTGGLTAGETVGVLLGNFNGASSYANWQVSSTGLLAIDWNGTSRSGATDLRDNNWHHVAFVRDKTANDIRGYVDGRLEFTLAGAQADLVFTTTHLIGNDRRATNKVPFHGNVDELAIFNRALSAEEIIVRAGKFDQRGLPRIISDAGNEPPVMDLGPLEFQERLLEVKSLQVTIFQDIVDPYDDLTSLREAINFANETATVDTITFDSSVFSDGDVLLLNGRELSITESIVINGAVDTTGRVTIDAGLRSRVLNFDDPGAGGTLPGNLTLNNLVLINGNSTEFASEGSGGAVRSRRTGTVSLVNTDVTNSSTLGRFARGGGIYSNGSIYMRQSTIQGNQTEGYFAQGGGLFAKTGILALNSTISDNRTLGDFSGGGGIAVYGPTASIQLVNSSVVGNAVSSFASAGGIGGANVTIQNSTITGNMSGFASDPDSPVIRLNPVSAPINLTLPTANGTQTFRRYMLANKNNGVVISPTSGDELTLIDIFNGQSTTVVSSFNLGALELGTFVTAENNAVGKWTLRLYGTFFAGGGGIVATNATITNSIVLGNASNTANNPEIKMNAGGTLSFTGKNLVGQSSSRQFGFDTSPFTNVSNADPSKVFSKVINRQAGIDFGSEALNIANGTLSGVLADNGGFVETVALRAVRSNPAIDAGSDGSSFLITDARGAGFQRIFNFPAFANNGSNAIDIGAFELQATVETASLHVTTALDVVDPNDFETSLREAIAFANTGDADGDGLALDKITFATGAGEVFATSRTIPMLLGQFSVVEPVAIDATGSAGIVTLDAGLNSRVINFTAPSGDLSLTKLTLTNGRAGGSNTALDPAFHGGALRSVSIGKVTLTQSTVSNSGTNNSRGGGIYAAGQVILNQSTIINNLAGVGGFSAHTRGGGVFANSVSLYESTIRDNASTSEGGGISATTVRVQSSTIDSNTSTGRGGGIDAVASGIGSVTMTNATIVGNRTLGSTLSPGGGVNSDLVSVANSTFTGNTTVGTNSAGGAIYATTKIEITNSILLGNLTLNAGGDEIQTFGQRSFLGRNLIGTNPSAFDATNVSNVENANIFFTFASTQLINGTSSTFRGNLESNGGLVRTVRLNPFTLNPALDAAQTDLVLASVDARGKDRFFDLLGYKQKADLGAYELNGDDATIDPPSLVVTTVDEGLPFDGKTSLREAIAFAETGDADGDLNLHDTVTFATGSGQAFQNGGTIVLTNGELRATQDLTIQSNTLVTIDANQQSRVINFTREGVDFGRPPADLTLRNLVLTNGRTTGEHDDAATVSTFVGGGVRFDSLGLLTLENTSVKNSATTGKYASGGGIFSAGSVKLVNSTIEANRTAGEKAHGGGVFASYYSTIENSTFHRNSTSGILASGGGIWANLQADIKGSTFSSNRVTGLSTSGGAILSGGGILNGISPEVHYDLTLTTSTLVGNSASSGGGLYAIGEAALIKTTLTGNSSISTHPFLAAGGVRSFRAITLTDSIVLGNFPNELLAAPSTLTGFGKNIVGRDSTTFDTSTHPAIVNANPNNVFAQTVETYRDSDANGTPDTPTGILGGALSAEGSNRRIVSLRAVNTNPALDSSRAPLALFRLDGTATDSIGTNNATLQGSLTATSTGIPNGVSQAINLDGFSNKFAELSSPLTIGNQSHTIEVWVKVPTLGSGGLNVGERVGPILSNVGAGPNASWEIDDHGELRFYWTDGLRNASGQLIQLLDLRGETDLRDGQWHHLAFVRDKTAGQFRAYVDGIAEALTAHANAGTDLTFTSTHRIGADRIEPTAIPFHGTIDELAIYGVALTQQEIAGRAAIPTQRIDDGNRDQRPVMDIGAVELKKTFVVDTDGDLDDNNVTPGHLSIREAVRLANASAGHDAITFDMNTDFGAEASGPPEIELTSQLFVNDSVSIIGPGANALSISGEGTSRIFNLGRVSSAATFIISGLKLNAGAVPRSPSPLPLEEGGAIRLDDNNDTVILDRVNVTNSSANGGGALFVFGSNYIISNSSFIGNTTSASGSAIMAFGNTKGWITNSTFSANSGSMTIMVQTASGHRGELQIRNSTIVDSTGSGVVVFSDGSATNGSIGLVEIGNSIVANSSGFNVFQSSVGTGVATFRSLGNNLSHVSSPFLNHPQDRVGNPLLAPLSTNGGQTPSRALLTGSPARNAGSNAIAVNDVGDTLVTDQRGLGFHRILGGTIDIGAFEAAINSAPTDINLNQNTVLENTSTSAADLLFGQLVTVDVDPADSHVYDLVAGTGDTDNARFRVVNDRIFIRQGQVLDFETKPSYSVRVRSTDSGGLSFVKQLTLNVTDVNEPVVLTRANASVTGNVLTQLTNTGTWSDPESGAVTLSASLGNVTKNANGTWSWTHTPSVALSGQVVTISANDGTNVSSISFSMTAFTTIATRGLVYVGATGTSASTSLATDKSALLPGQSSTFANYTNYIRGLNGLVIDVVGLPATVTNAQLAASLLFANWDGIAAAGFVALPGAAVPTVSIVAGGVVSSTRVRITFPDNTVQNTWLRVTVVANAQTGLALNDVFYFGNVIGEMNIGNSDALRVSAIDATAVLLNQSPDEDSASVTNIYDVNRDGRVSGIDRSFVLINQQPEGIVAPITAPSAFGRLGSGASSGEGEAGLSKAQMSSTVPKAPLPESSIKKKRPDGDTQYSQLDNYFAKLELDLDDVIAE